MQKQRGRGVPRNDVERAREHYPWLAGYSNGQVIEWLESGELTLPGRGYGLESGRAAMGSPIITYEGVEGLIAEAEVLLRHIGQAVPSYVRGEATTVEVTVHNTSGAPLTCYARAWLDWKSFGVWQMDDPARRTWIRFDLAVDETKTMAGHTYIGPSEPLGARVGRVYLYTEQDPNSTVLDSDELANAAYVSAVAGDIVSQAWL